MGGQLEEVYLDFVEDVVEDVVVGNSPFRSSLASGSVGMYRGAASAGLYSRQAAG